jgi:hypothetical protein
MPTLRHASVPLLGLTLSLSLHVACSGDAETGGSSTGGAGGGTGGGSTTTTNAGGSTSSGGAGGAGTCGGFAGEACGPDEFCDFVEDSCGAADRVGVCTPKPMACDRIYDPVCGCDGQVHDNGCIANSDGTDVSNAGGCAMPPAGTFACGPKFCLKLQQYCRQVNDDTGQPPSYSCVSLPQACTGMNASCMCLANEPCADNECVQDAAGDIKITCFGG